VALNPTVVCILNDLLPPIEPFTQTKIPATESRRYGKLIVFASQVYGEDYFHRRRLFPSTTYAQVTPLKLALHSVSHSRKLSIELISERTGVYRQVDELLDEKYPNLRAVVSRPSVPKDSDEATDEGVDKGADGDVLNTKFKENDSDGARAFLKESFDWKERKSGRFRARLL
jgi:hypothetical protein